MRRGAILWLILIGVVVGALTSVIAVVVPWLPDQASEQRERIDFVFWLTTWICVSIFALVAAVIIYAAWKFRARPDDDSDGPPIHGHTGLEIAWTAVPAILVIIIGIASAVAVARNERLGDNPLRIEVTGQQFAWTFQYPNGITTGDLRLPRDRTVLLRLTARDVIHSFWVPQFGQKIDAVPGQITELVITPTKNGQFPVVCTELCGLGHALMRSRALVMEPGEFETWLARQGETVAEGGAEAGAAVFENNGCGACHTFTPANAEGRQGPSLDELAQGAREAGQPLEEYTRESILEPNAYIHPGYAPIMPDTYDELPDDQLDALVQYLVEAQEESG